MIVTLIGLYLGMQIQPEYCSSQQLLKKLQECLLKLPSPPARPDYIRSVTINVDAASKATNIFILTWGITRQSEVYSDLAVKFGKPDESFVETLQNGFGATYDVVSAMWRIRNERL